MTGLRGVDPAVLQAIGEAKNLPEVAKVDRAFAEGAARELCSRIATIVDEHAREIPPALATRMLEALAQARKLGVDNRALTERVAHLNQTPSAPARREAQSPAQVRLPEQGAPVGRRAAPGPVASLLPDEEGPRAPRFEMPRAQLFGTDFPANSAEATIKATLVAALKAGYRTFDMAAKYEKAVPAQLAAACHELKIDRQELTLVYKVAPEADRTRVSATLERFATDFGSYPDVLVLHELGDERSNAATLGVFADAVRAGRSKAIGLSNVTALDLPGLAEQVAALGAPLACVQNRCTPYAPDREVRDWCAQHSLAYQAYGIQGRAMQGACVEAQGHGDPRGFLSTREDLRLRALAEQSGIPVSTLVLGWMEQRGVSAVAFSTDAEHMTSNRGAATKLRLSQELMRELDRMFGPVSAEARQGLGGSPALQALYTSSDDPTVWATLDLLTGRTAARPTAAQEKVRALLETASAGLPEAADKQNLCLRLMRYVANFQAYAAQERREHPELQPQHWSELLGPALASIQDAIAQPGVRDRFLYWAKQSCLGAEPYREVNDVAAGIIEPRRLPHDGETLTLSVQGHRCYDHGVEVTFWNDAYEPVQPTRELVCTATRSGDSKKVRIEHCDAREVRYTGLPG